MNLSRKLHATSLQAWLRKQVKALTTKSEEIVCHQQTPQNRIAALIAGYAGLFVTILILAGAFADARHKDQLKASQLAAMTDQDRAESLIDENLGFGRAIIDSDGTIIKWSGALPKWTRWTDAVGKPLLMIIPEEMRAAHVSAFNAALAAHADTGQYTTQVVKCKLPRIDDMTKGTHVTIVTNIVRPENGGRPLIVAHVYRTKAVRAKDVQAMGDPHASATVNPNTAFSGSSE